MSLTDTTVSGRPTFKLCRYSGFKIDGPNCRLHVGTACHQIYYSQDRHDSVLLKAVAKVKRRWFGLGAMSAITVGGFLAVLYAGLVHPFY